MSAPKRKAKFWVGQVVRLVGDDRIYVRIEKVHLHKADKPSYDIGLTADWYEDELRPLTVRERGERGRK